MKTTIIFALACFMIATGTTALYRQFRPEWVDFRKGEESFMKGEYTEASVHYRHAIERGLTEPSVFLRCSQAQLLDADYPGAEETASEYLRHPVWRPDHAYELAEIFLSKGRFGTTLEILQKVVSENPEDRKARFRLAQVLAWTHEFEASIGHYHKLLESNHEKHGQEERE
ncbi:MAG: tetratricopeptide repeat protein [Kiritimatiellia bacterium]